LLTLLPASLTLWNHPFIAGTISQAVQPAVHDVTDVTCAQSWFNSPLTTSLTADIYKVRRRELLAAPPCLTSGTTSPALARRAVRT
jgi:hypothetical protein